MASVNISITDDAYRFLKMLKGRDKSFSDVILEMKTKGVNRKGSKENVLRFAGILKDKNINWDEVENNIQDFRDSFNKRVERTRNQMSIK
ncbi:MAG: antitoxin VapB family protein [Nanoarchaeota archaeon]|nr:antitoxin VapB family protein [Nanoarchaeota archaeon]